MKYFKGKDVGKGGMLTKHMKTVTDGGGSASRIVSGRIEPTAQNAGAKGAAKAGKGTNTSGAASGVSGMMSGAKKVAKAMAGGNKAYDAMVASKKRK